MSVTANIDLREFNKALKELHSLGKREFADVCNDNMADLCLTASRYPAKANRADISGLVGKPWWPALIHKVITGGTGYVVKFKKRLGKAGKGRIWKDPINGKIMSGQQTASEFRTIKDVKKKALRSLFSGRVKGVRDANAARVSASIIKRRLARVGAMRAYLGLAGVKFAPWKQRRGGYGRKNLKGVTAKLAGKGGFAGFKSAAEAMWKFTNNYSAWVNSSQAPRGRPSPAQDVVTKTHILAVALNRAVPEVTARLRHAINVKLQRMAKKHGAQGRAIVRTA